MDKILYSVFVSSTYKDLIDERQEAIQAILKSECFPIGMEFFPASSVKLEELLKKYLSLTDIYIVITKGRYGTKMENGISFTEFEYDQAISSGKSVLAFIHSNPESVKYPEETDEDFKKLQAFNKKLSDGKNHSSNWWNEKDKLYPAINKAISEELLTKSAIGWNRNKYANTTTNQLYNENNLIEIIKNLRNEKTINYIIDSYHAFYLGCESELAARGQCNVDIFTFLLKEGYDFLRYTPLHKIVANLKKVIYCSNIELKEINKKNDLDIFIDTDNVKSLIFKLENLNILESKRNQNNNEMYWKFTKLGDQLYKKIKADEV